MRSICLGSLPAEEFKSVPILELLSEYRATSVLIKYLMVCDVSYRLFKERYPLRIRVYSIEHVVVQCLLQVFVNQRWFFHQ